MNRYLVKIVNAAGEASPKPHVMPGENIPEDFGSYGEANRWAIDHASIEPGHVTYVVAVEQPRFILAAYHSLSELRHGKVSMLDGSCAADVSEIPELARKNLEWFKKHWAEKKAG